MYPQATRRDFLSSFCSEWLFSNRRLCGILDYFGFIYIRFAKHYYIMSLQELHELTDVLLTKDEEVIRAKKEWESTFDSVPDLIVIFNTDQIITNVNKSFCSDVGIKKEEIVGKHYRDLFYNDCSDINESCVKYMNNLNGWYQITVSQLYDNNTVIGSVHILHDITQLKEAEIELIKKNDEMKEMSHDLANRIRRIEVFLNEFRAKYENTIKYAVMENDNC